MKDNFYKAYLQNYLQKYPEVGYIINNPNLIYPKEIYIHTTSGGIQLDGQSFIQLWFDFVVYKTDITNIFKTLNKYQQQLFKDICRQNINFKNPYKEVKRGKSIALFKYENIPIYGLKGDSYVTDKKLLEDLNNTNLSNFCIVLNSKNEIIKTVGIESWKLIKNSKFKIIKEHK